MHRLFQSRSLQYSIFRKKCLANNVRPKQILRASTVNTSNPIFRETEEVEPDYEIETTNKPKNIFGSENVSFGNMTTLQMMRSIFVLTVCSLPGLANNAPKVLDVARKYLGRTIFSKIMRITFYGQFVSGNDVEEIKQTTAQLEQCNVLPMLAVAIEDKIEGSDISGEELYEYNTSKVIDCINVASRIRNSDRPCMMQLKLTAMFDFDLLERLSDALTESSNKSTELASWIENGSSMDALTNIFSTLTTQQVSDLASGLSRIMRIATRAEKDDVNILIDAEYTWVNPAIHCVSIAMMKAYNKNCARVYTTYQAYLKETRDQVQFHAKECENHGVYLGFKLVRGAYLIPETLKAGMHPKWMCDDLQATNDNFNSCVQDIFKMDKEKVQVMFATHNEDSVRLIAELLSKRRNKEKSDTVQTMLSNIRFGQLYGMADYMSFTLGKMGYEVYKSLPYGSIEETMPYLCRRAKENTLFLTGVRKEMIMLRTGLAMKIGFKI